jgi:predicted esterase
MIHACAVMAVRTVLLAMLAPAVAWGSDVLSLEVPGHAPAYYVPPVTTRKIKPIVLWVHGRGGHPESDCRKWSQVTRPYGWLLCPSGPEDRGDGARGWNNSWPQSKTTIDAAVAALRKEHGRSIRTHGHILIGFSEGAYVAMNVGVREPGTFNRWLILAANDVYWGGEGVTEYRKAQGRLRKVYLLTGEQDGVVDNTRKVFDIMEHHRTQVRLWTPPDIGHEVPAERMKEFYTKPLRWLTGS